MSENPAEIDDKELEQISGGTAQSVPEEVVNIQDMMGKMSQSSENAAAALKRMDDAVKAAIQNMR